MFDFTSLDSARKKTGEKSDKKHEQFYTLYESALDKFRGLIRKQTFDAGALKIIAAELLEALKLVKNQAEPYLFLAYIFYIIGDQATSLKYLKVSSFLNPELPGIEKLRIAIASEPASAKNIFPPVNTNESRSTDLSANSNRAPPKIAPVRRLKR
jgi:hypothetical protein